MANLTDEAKLAIKTEVDVNIQEFKNAIFVINTYKWIAGVILTVLGLGTFLGINALLDNKVDKRMQLFDGFMIAEDYIQKGQSEKAYDLMTVAWDDLKNEKPLTKVLRNLYYEDMIDILSGMMKYDKFNKSFVGLPTWNELINDSKFSKFLEKTPGDYYMKINRAICKIKFENNSKALGALNLIDQISNSPDSTISTHESNEFLDRRWYPFVINIIKNDTNRAKKYYKELTSYQSYYFENFKKDKHLNKDLGVLIYWNNINEKINEGKGDDLFTKMERLIK